MTFTKKQVSIASVIGTVFVSITLSPAYGAVFAGAMLTHYITHK